MKTLKKSLGKTTSNKLAQQLASTKWRESLRLISLGQNDDRVSIRNIMNDCGFGHVNVEDISVSF